MNNKSQTDTIVHCRQEMTKLLLKTMDMTYKLEQRLDIPDDWEAQMAKRNCDVSAILSLQVSCALLLHKALIHSAAVFRASETNNISTLAVQMEPILECAGQVVFYFQTLIVPELEGGSKSAIERVGTRINREHYQIMRKLSKGKIDRDELMREEYEIQEEAAMSVGASKPKRDNKRRFTQADKLAMLRGGRSGYDFLKKFFSHTTETHWYGPSILGGMKSTNTVGDMLAFLELIGFLVNQITHMNMAAALCPVKNDDDAWENWVKPAMKQREFVHKSVNQLLNSARDTIKDPCDGKT